MREISDSFDGIEHVPATSLFGRIGVALFRDILNIDESTLDSLFQTIENGINSADDYFSTAVATGLIEAMIHVSEFDQEQNDVRWKKAYNLFGSSSRKYADAWIDWEGFA